MAEFIEKQVAATASAVFVNGLTVPAFTRGILGRADITVQPDGVAVFDALRQFVVELFQLRLGVLETAGILPIAAWDATTWAANEPRTVSFSGLDWTDVTEYVFEVQEL